MSNQTTQLRTQYEAQEQRIRDAELFLIKYESKLPPEDFGNLLFTTEHITFYIDLQFATPSDRDRALTLLGDVFGRSGWEAQLEYRGRHFDWSKVIDGNVRLSISGAQLLDKPEKFPVDPKQFPLQLEEHAGSIQS